MSVYFSSRPSNTQEAFECPYEESGTTFGIYSTNVIVLASFYFGGHSPSLTSKHSVVTCLFIPVVTIDRKEQWWGKRWQRIWSFYLRLHILTVKWKLKKKIWLFHSSSSLRSRFLWQVFQSLCQSKLPITPVVSVCQIPSVTSTPSYEDQSSTQKKMGKLIHLKFATYAVWSKKIALLWFGHCRSAFTFCYPKFFSNFLDYHSGL